MEGILDAFRRIPNHSKVCNKHGPWVHTFDSDYCGGNQYVFTVDFPFSFSASQYVDCPNFDELVAAGRAHFENVPCTELCDSEEGVDDSEGGADDSSFALPSVYVDDISCLVEFGSVEEAAEFVHGLMTVVWQDAPYEISSY